MKRCQTWLLNGEMQIKIGMRCHLIPNRMAVLWNIGANKRCQGVEVGHQPKSCLKILSTPSYQDIPWDLALPTAVSWINLTLFTCQVPGDFWLVGINLLIPLLCSLSLLLLTLYSSVSHCSPDPTTPQEILRFPWDCHQLSYHLFLEPNLSLGALVQLRLC